MFKPNQIPVVYTQEGLRPVSPVQFRSGKSLPVLGFSEYAAGKVTGFRAARKRDIKRKSLEAILYWDEDLKLVMARYSPSLPYLLCYRGKLVPIDPRGRHERKPKEHWQEALWPWIAPIPEQYMEDIPNQYWAAKEDVKDRFRVAGLQQSSAPLVDYIQRSALEEMDAQLRKRGQDKAKDARRKKWAGKEAILRGEQPGFTGHSIGLDGKPAEYGHEFWVVRSNNSENRRWRAEDSTVARDYDGWLQLHRMGKLGIRDFLYLTHRGEGNANRAARETNRYKLEQALAAEPDPVVRARIYDQWPPPDLRGNDAYETWKSFPVLELGGPREQTFATTALGESITHGGQEQVRGSFWSLELRKKVSVPRPTLYSIVWTGRMVELPLVTVRNQSKNGAKTPGDRALEELFMLAGRAARHVFPERSHYQCQYGEAIDSLSPGGSASAPPGNEDRHRHDLIEVVSESLAPDLPMDDRAIAAAEEDGVSAAEAREFYGSIYLDPSEKGGLAKLVDQGHYRGYEWDDPSKSPDENPVDD